MVDIEAFGLESDSDLTEKLLGATLRRPSRIFPGFNNAYLYRNFGYAEFVFNVAEDKDGNPQILGGSTHCMGDHIYRMRVEQRVSDNDVESIYVCSSLSGRGVTLAVNTVMGDTVPPLMKGDLITFQGIGIPKGDFNLTLSREKAARLLTYRDYVPDDGLIIPGASHESIYNMIFSKVRSFDEFPFIEGHTLYSVEVWSDAGTMTILVPPGYLEGHKGIHDALRKGRDVYLVATFYLSGDVAVGKYNEGAIYDEEHLLRLLRASVSDGKYERLDKFLSPSLTTDGFSSDDGLPKALEALVVPSGRDNEDIRTDIYKVSKALIPEKAMYDQGKLLLGVESKRFSGAFAIEVSGEDITHVSLITENIYEAVAEKPPESAEERYLRENPCYSETRDGWYVILSSWAGGDKSCSMKVFYGLAKDVVLRQGDTAIIGLDEVYPALESNIRELGKISTEELKSALSIKVSIRGLLKEIAFIK